MHLSFLLNLFTNCCVSFGKDSICKNPESKVKPTQFRLHLFLTILRLTIPPMKSNSIMQPCHFAGITKKDSPFLNWSVRRISRSQLKLVLDCCDENNKQQTCVVKFATTCAISKENDVGIKYQLLHNLVEKGNNKWVHCRKKVCKKTVITWTTKRDSKLGWIHSRLVTWRVNLNQNSKFLRHLSIHAKQQSDKQTSSVFDQETSTATQW